MLPLSLTHTQKQVISWFYLSNIFLLDKERKQQKQARMDWWQNGVDYGNTTSNTRNESNIWPIEHPNEPQDEDQPIKCPTPHPSLLNANNETEQFSGFPRNRADTLLSVLNKEEMVGPSEPRERPIRKRHHRRSTSRKDNASNPSIAPSRHSFSAHDNLKAFPIFRNFYKES